MSSSAAVTVVAAVAGTCGVAMVGWVLDARDTRRTRRDARPSKRSRYATTAFIILTAVGAAIAASSISVFWMVLALNFLLGIRENIPFSAYSMFSQPATTAWTLRFEDSKGELISIAKIGLAPHVMRKRFATEMHAARKRGISDMDAARRKAATVLAALLEQRRPSRGPLAASPITIVLIEYSLDSGKLITVKTPIMETTPP
jgi:hypothetical protein